LVNHDYLEVFSQVSVLNHQKMGVKELLKALILSLDYTLIILKSDLKHLLKLSISVLMAYCF